MKITFHEMQDKELFSFDVSDNVPAWVIFTLAQSMLGKIVELEPGTAYTINYAKSPAFGNIRIFKMIED
jgi:hypothetical protein